MWIAYFICMGIGVVCLLVAILCAVCDEYDGAGFFLALGCFFLFVFGGLSLLAIMPALVVKWFSGVIWILFVICVIVSANNYK